MKKIVLSFLVIISLLQISFVCKAWPGQEKVKKNIIGTWKFIDFYNYYVPYMSRDTKVSTDPSDLYRVYTFMDNGKVTLWSLDKSKYDLPSQTFTWGVITKEDSYGEKYTAVKLVESDIDPSDIQKIESTNTGIIYVVTASTKDRLLWIKVLNHEKTWKKEWQSRFTRMPDLPK